MYVEKDVEGMEWMHGLEGLGRQQKHSEQKHSAATNDPKFVHLSI